MGKTLVSQSPYLDKKTDDFKGTKRLGEKVKKRVSRSQSHLLTNEAVEFKNLAFKTSSRKNSVFSGLQVLSPSGMFVAHLPGGPGHAASHRSLRASS